MNAAEAKAAGMTDDRARLSYFKSDLANSSMTKPTEANDWYRFVSVNLMNGGADPDTGAPTEGDSVGVVVKWEYKKLALDLDASTAREAVAALEEGGPWRADRRADKWAGHAIAKAAGVDIAADGVGVQIAGLIAEWVKDGTQKSTRRKTNTGSQRSIYGPNWTLANLRHLACGTGATTAALPQLTGCGSSFPL